MILIGKLPDSQIDILNKRLVEYYGTTDEKANFKVIWWDGSIRELRKFIETPDGFRLITPEVREVPKYQHIAHERYVLERLTEVQGETDIVTKLSYESLWTFEDSLCNALVPTWPATKLIIETVLKNIEQAGNYVKYKEPNREESLAEEAQRLAGLYEDLFGNETETTDALSVKEAIVVPPTYTTQGAEKCKS